MPTSLATKDKNLARSSEQDLFPAGHRRECGEITFIADPSCDLSHVECESLRSADFFLPVSRRRSSSGLASDGKAVTLERRVSEKMWQIDY